ncbi:hypothetical protein [Micromonospora coxensis]|uniref:Uncharacterized protein n=1 Tax=Micromonospora coxensis TaxID=356852 RepID=A0A1C5IDE8_9ACTN|nr:hypothetical protein [Micromonospora coxensis]SCG56205.1 hypothetical protein GA0070614_2608 [Micromonospora coxensis]
MSRTTGPEQLGIPTSYFDHAMRLHRAHPDGPLPNEGRPCPDGDERPRRASRSKKWDARRQGMDVAAALDAYFADPGATPADLADAVRGLSAPIGHNPHIAAAALRAERERVRRTGRWLVRRGTRHEAVVVGLALLAEDHDDRDIPLIQTIGLLSHATGPLAAHALRRRRGSGAALAWLAQRVSGWGRVYVMEALCRSYAPETRDWMLRHGCDGDYLAGYYTGDLAVASHLAEAIRADEVDDELLAHTTRVLDVMTWGAPLGTSFAHYPPAPAVLDAHLRHLARRQPTVVRYLAVVRLAAHLHRSTPERVSCTPEQHRRLLADHLALLERNDWAEAARAGLDPTDGYHVEVARTFAPQLGLHAFDGFGPG